MLPDPLNPATFLTKERMGFQRAQIKAAKTRVYLPLTTATTVNNHPGCQECEVEPLYIPPNMITPYSQKNIGCFILSTPPALLAEALTTHFTSHV